ncbi:MAG TPA: pantetheine-phosphate adenylyltransferase [Syntrophales bacterium]|nr:pantetheine-phosphate adenylyltransferase [Syntrophales bacterium]
MKRLAVYPGSFDPITNGHTDLVKRGLKMFDEIIILIATNPNKASFFSVEERLEMIREIYKDNEKVKVDSYPGLLVDYLKQCEANIIFRGLRALSDFEYEFQMALMNRRLSRDVETVFLMAGFKWFYTSSSIIKEAATHGGSVKGMVPEIVYRQLQAKYAKLNGG